MGGLLRKTVVKPLVNIFLKHGCIDQKYLIFQTLHLRTLSGILGYVYARKVIDGKDRMKGIVHFCSPPTAPLTALAVQRITVPRF